MIKFAILATCLLPIAAPAQLMCALGSGSSYKPSSDQRPSPDALELTAQAYASAKVICGTNCPQIVLFRNPTAANLILLNDAGRAKLVYSPQTFKDVYARHGDFGIIALVAHALGHALDDAIGAPWIEKSWTAELRADAWSGCILAKSTPSPADAQSALAALEQYPSPAHPSWNVRLGVIRSGYTNCGGVASLNAKTK